MYVTYTHKVSWCTYDKCHIDLGHEVENRNKLVYTRHVRQTDTWCTYATDRHMVYIYDMTHAIDTWLSVEARIYKLCYICIYIPMGIISMYKKKRGGGKPTFLGGQV